MASVSILVPLADAVDGASELTHHDEMTLT